MAISLDELKAELWKEDVKAEIEQVNLILQKASKALADYPEKDTVMEKIAEVGDSLNETWNTACRWMADSIIKVEDAVKEYKKAFEKNLESVGNFKSKAK